MDANLGLSLRIVFVMKVSRIALIVLTRMIIIMDELCYVTAMTIATKSITGTVIITTVAAQQQNCPSYDIVC